MYGNAATFELISKPVAAFWATSPQPLPYEGRGAPVWITKYLSRQEGIGFTFTNKARRGIHPHPFQP
jgi:hypothetical protein